MVENPQIIWACAFLLNCASLTISNNICKKCMQLPTPYLIVGVQSRIYNLVVLLIWN